MTRFRVSRLAQSDLKEIRHFIAQDKPTAADKQLARFFKYFHLLAKNPEMGERRPEFAGADLRASSLGNYVIFYRAIENGVEIARVVSGFRDLKALFEPAED